MALGIRQPVTIRHQLKIGVALPVNWLQIVTG